MRSTFRRFWPGWLGLTAALTLVAPPSLAAVETPAEQANKQLVLDFYAALNRADATGTMKDSIKGIAEKYLGSGYVQHSPMFANLPGPGSPRDRLVRMFQSLPPRPAAGPPPQTVAIMAEGDKVMMLTSRSMSGGAASTYIFNMFRVVDGKLVEHWDVMPEAAGPPPGQAPVPPGADAKPMPNGR